MSTHASVSPTPVSLWFDPACPYTWITTRWVVSVAAERGLELSWRPFSLKYLNRENPENQHAQRHAETFRMLRVVQAISQAPGTSSADIGAFYAQLGTRFHEQHDPQASPARDTAEYTSALIDAALAEAGLDASFAAAKDDSGFDAAIEESTEQALKLTGRGVGIPIIGIGETAFFGPVLKQRPRGREALQLWDAFTVFAANPDFQELKRQVRKPYSFE